MKPLPRTEVLCGGGLAEGENVGEKNYKRSQAYTYTTIPEPTPLPVAPMRTRQSERASQTAPLP